LKQNYGTLNGFKQKKLANCKVVDRAGLYNFDMKFIFIQPHIKKLWAIFMQRFLKAGFLKMLALLIDLISRD
jgi:hypothetical protein